MRIWEGKKFIDIDAETLARQLTWSELTNMHIAWIERCNEMQEPKPTQECEHEWKYKSQGSGKVNANWGLYKCRKCGNEAYMANSEPKPEQIEDLDLPELAICDYGDTDRIVEHLLTLGKKIRELIKHINHLTRGKGGE